MIPALLLLNLITLYRLKSLEKNMNNGFQQRDFADKSLREDISSIYSNVETKLKKQGSILDKYNISFGELNPDNFTVPVTLSIAPKEYSKGLIASLQLNDKSILMKNNETHFDVTVEAYIFDDFNLKVILENNGVKKVETLEEYTDFRKKYLLDISGGFAELSAYYTSKEYEYKGKIDLNFGNSQSSSVEKISIVNDVNGTIINERKIEPSNSVSLDVKENIKLTAGEKLTIYAVVQDTHGLNYKYILEIIEAGSNEQQPVNNNFTGEVREVTEIKNKNGALVYEPRKNIVK